MLICVFRTTIKFIWKCSGAPSISIDSQVEAMHEEVGRLYVAVKLQVEGNLGHSGTNLRQSLAGVRAGAQPLESL